MVINVGLLVGDTLGSLQANKLFGWVYVHTYTCLDYVQRHFKDLLPDVSVMHNATGVETLIDNDDRPRIAIFNRNVCTSKRMA